MTEYKDAEAIKAQIREVCRDCWTIQRVGGCAKHCGINEAIKAVDAVPPTDAIPIDWINLFNSTPIGGDSIDDLLREWRYKQEVEAEREREDGEQDEQN